MLMNLNLSDIYGEEEESKLNKISDIEPDPSELLIKTESDESEQSTTMPTPFVWGNSAVVNACAEGNKGPSIPPFTVKKGKDDIYYIHLFTNRSGTPAEGQLYQLLGALTESDVVHLHIHEVSFFRTILLQSAVANSKAKIHTFVSMIEPHGYDSCKFFLWMMGKVLTPIPHNIVGLVEPLTIFSHAMGSTMDNRRNCLEYDKVIKQQWYDHAVNLGLLTLDEVSVLNEGKMLMLTDINERVARLNIKTT